MTSVYCPDKTICFILDATDELNRLNDVDSILDRILLDARTLTGADAGSIFLTEGNTLRFAYVQNDTLFQSDSTNAVLYQDMTLPMGEGSIVGHAALTGETLMIDDAYELDPTLPYEFDKSFDEKSGYKTTSMLTMPIRSQENRMVGVIQLINARNERRKIIPFRPESETFLKLLANQAGVAIQRGLLNRELVLRMMQMAEMRDPTETGAHVQRVGAYCAEIYQRMAQKRGTDPREVRSYRDRIRLAAMLHDVGKVSISDTILKKPGKLTDEEFTCVKMHTISGARLFRNQTSNLDRMSMDIALRHHEKWSGSGYPGIVPDLWSPNARPGIPMQGRDIPLSARICAVADVFDALTTPRSYKDAWPVEKAYSVLEEESGSHFDPEVIEAFMDILPIITAIRERFQDNGL